MNDDIQPEVGAVLTKDLENIAAKVAAGKTLTSSEREFFMGQQPEVKDDGKITTKVMLAKALGISRDCLYRWWKMSGAPTEKVDGGFDLQGWREFAKRNDLKDFGDGIEGATLAEQKKHFETLILKAKYQTLISELIPVAVVEKLLTQKAIEIRKVIMNSALNEDEKDKVLDELHELREHKFRP
jgi:hypothetical protein